MQARVTIKIEDTDTPRLNTASVNSHSLNDDPLIVYVNHDDWGNAIVGQPNDVLQFAAALRTLVFAGVVQRAFNENIKFPTFPNYGMFSETGNNIVGAAVSVARDRNDMTVEDIRQAVIAVGKMQHVLVNEVWDTSVGEEISYAIEF